MEMRNASAKGSFGSKHAAGGEDSKLEFKWVNQCTAFLDEDRGHTSWEDHWPPHMKDWSMLSTCAEGKPIKHNGMARSPSASESSSSLSTQESSSFSAASDSSVKVRRGLSPLTATSSARFTDPYFPPPHFSEAAIVHNSAERTLKAPIIQECSLTQNSKLSSRSQDEFYSFRLLGENTHGSCEFDVVETPDGETSDSDHTCSESEIGKCDAAIQFRSSAIIGHNSNTPLEISDDDWTSDSCSWTSASSLADASTGFWKSPKDVVTDTAALELASQLDGHKLSDTVCTETDNHMTSWHDKDRDAGSKSVKGADLITCIEENELLFQGSCNDYHSVDEKFELSDEWHHSFHCSTAARNPVKRCEAGRASQSCKENICVTASDDNLATHITKDFHEELSGADVPEEESFKKPTEAPSSEALDQLQNSVKNGLKDPKTPQHGILETCSSRTEWQQPAQTKSGSSKPLIPISTQIPVSFPFAEPNHNVKPSILKYGHSVPVRENLPPTSVHGYFRYLEQGGAPCYAFFVNDSDEVFFARAHKPQKHSNKENCDWMYSFHSRRDIAKVKGAWKGWLKREKLASDLVGKMKVSKQASVDKCTKETQFVLFDDRINRSSKSQSVDGQLPPKPLVGCRTTDFCEAAVPGIQSQKQRTTHLRSSTEPQVSQRMAGSYYNTAGLMEETRKHRLTTVDACVSSKDVPSSGLATSGQCGKGSNDQPSFSQMELAAFIISTSMKESRSSEKKDKNVSSKDTGGWGMKFLDKGSGNGWGLKFLDNSAISDSTPAVKFGVSAHAQNCTCLSCTANGEPTYENKACLDSCKNVASDDKRKLPTRRKDRRAKVMVDVTVILPAGVHGLPADSSIGPTPLVDRWKCGGTCDCGGWDEGCGIQVLRAEPLMVHGQGAHVALTNHDRINWLSSEHPLKISTQGYKRRKVLVLEIVQAGLFSLTFQARFSPLQAFATAVAFFHLQIVPS